MKNATRTAKNSPRRVTVSSETVDGFTARSLERARKMDRSKRLPSEITMTFEDPADLIWVLSGSGCECYMPCGQNRRRFPSAP